MLFDTRSDIEHIETTDDYQRDYPRGALGARKWPRKLQLRKQPETA
jgi:hypothetical protein